MEKTSTAVTDQKSGWLQIAETGSLAGIKWFVFLVTFVGRPAARAWLKMVIFYYTVFIKRVRVESARYFSRLGLPHGFWDAYRHSLRFGECVIDRLFFVRGKTDGFEVDRVGEEHLLELYREKKGAILLTAHLGSFEAMRAFATEMDFRVNVLVNTANAQMINRVLVSLNPTIQVRMLDVSSGLDFIFTARKRLEAGEMVSIMGDRVGPDARTVTVPFLGAPAPFPTGAYELAAAFGCPVYLVLGLYRGKNRYSLICEPFADKVELPRATRKEALEHYARKYAERLEHYCKEVPDNWFNFFDFWSTADKPLE